MESYVREACLNHLTDCRGLDRVRNKVLEKGYVINEITIPVEAGNLFQNAYGGFLMCLIDTAGCMAAWSHAKRVVTQGVDVHFVRGIAVGEHVEVEAVTTHVGSTSVLSDVRIVNAEGDLCVSATVTMFSLGEVTADDPLPSTVYGRNAGVA